MRFAFIGTNAAAWPLLDEIRKSGQHSLTTSVIEGALRKCLAEAAVSVRLAAMAEDVLLGQDVDIVVLALEDCDEILRLSRAASQAEKSIVLFLPSVSASPALSFELQLILDESRVAILPITGRWRLSNLALGSQTLGLSPADVHQVSLEMPLAQHSETQLLEGVRDGLDILSASGFRYSQVTCLDARTPDGGLISRLVTLNSQNEAEVRLPPASLTLRPGQDTAEVLLKIVSSAGVTTTFPIVPPDYLPRIQHFYSQKSLCAASMDECSTTLELCEAVAKSIRRRRTVDVHFDAGTERSLFKSQMTAIGCGVLSWLLLGMVAYLIAGQLLTLPDWMWQTARIIWMLPLILFLAAQFLLPLARDRANDGRRGQSR